LNCSLGQTAQLCGTLRLSPRAAENQAQSATPVHITAPTVFLLPCYHLNKLLLDLGAAALDQNKQNDNRENSSDNPNDRGVIHFDSSFLQ
jgi:hypothetical protein